MNRPQNSTKSIETDPGQNIRALRQKYEYLVQNQTTQIINRLLNFKFL